MNRLYIFLSLVLVAIWITPVGAETEFGIMRQSGWSDNKYLDNPSGWGGFVSKNITTNTVLRFSFNRLNNRDQYIGIMQFGFPPPGADSTREVIRSETSVDLYEFSVHYVFVNGSKMQLDAGTGIGGGNFDLHLFGKSTGKRQSVEQSPMMATFSVNATVKQFIRTQLALRLGYKFRTMSTMEYNTDIFEPFNDVSFSSMHVTLLLRI